MVVQTLQAQGGGGREEGGRNDGARWRGERQGGSDGKRKERNVKTAGGRRRVMERWSEINTRMLTRSSQRSSADINLCGVCVPQLSFEVRLFKVTKASVRQPT